MGNLFIISENIAVMKDVNKQLQLVLEDTLYKVSDAKY